MYLFLMLMKPYDQWPNNPNDTENMGTPLLDDLQRWPLNNAHWLAIDSQYNGTDCTCIEMQHIWWRHDDVIKWKHSPRYWLFARGIHWSPMNSPRKGHWRGALMFPLICASTNGWANTRDAGDLRRHRGHYDVTVIVCRSWESVPFPFQHSKCHVLSQLVHYCALLWFVTSHFNHNPVPLKLMISSGTPVSSGVQIPISMVIIISLVQR